jgi:hypothetical protein
MQRELQNVIWILGSGKDKIVEINSNNEKIFFSKDTIEESYKHDLFSLYDLENDLMYSIDLNTGEFIINGVSIEICKNISGRMISFSNLGIDYRKGLIQYKESKPISLGSNNPVSPKNYNIGLHFDLSDKDIIYNMGSYKSKITNVKAIISIDADTLKLRMSISITEKRFFRDGKEVVVSL